MGSKGLWGSRRGCEREMWGHKWGLQDNTGDNRTILGTTGQHWGPQDNTGGSEGAVREEFGGTSGATGQHWSHRSSGGAVREQFWGTSGATGKHWGQQDNIGGSEGAVSE